MDIELYTPPSTPPRVPAQDVAAALADARAVVPVRVHRTVALSVGRGSEQTGRLRLERLARVVMATDGRITSPAQVWAADWSQLPVEAVEALDRGIRATWPAVSTRNAMRDSVRAVIRESRDAGVITHDQATPRLSVLRPERAPRDPEKQARGHLPAAQVAEAFTALAQDDTLTARRDTALLALLVGAGLRRDEATRITLSDLDAACDTVVVTGKGGAVRSVPLAPGVRRAITEWISHRGDEPGPLLTPVTREKPRQALPGQRMAGGTVAQVVRRRVGESVRPHDLRRTFVGDLLDSGADLSVASQVLGHTSPATTAGYDRRGHTARRAAVERLHVPVG